MRWAGALAFLIACESETHPPVDWPYPTCPGCAHAQYAIGGLTIPAQRDTDQFACEFGYGPFNGLAKSLNLFSELGPNLDFRKAISDAFTRGDLAMVLDMEYEPALADAHVAGIKMFLGHHDPSDGIEPPAFYQGGRFVVGGPGLGEGGQLANGCGGFGPGKLYLELPLPDGLPPLRLLLYHASIRGTFAADGIHDGIICGAIPASQIQTILIPTAATIISIEAQRGNIYARDLFDLDHSCNTDPACQPGAIGTCGCVTVDEVLRSEYRYLLFPDVDLDPTIDNPFVTDASDPTIHNDALSIGLGFEAATVDLTVE